MESNKIDKLFKNKLERNSLPVSADAWKQLDNRLKEKKGGKKVGVIWMIAASISIILVAISSILFLNQREVSNQLADSFRIDLNSEKVYSASINTVPEIPKAIEKVSVTKIKMSKADISRSNIAQTNINATDQVYENTFIQEFPELQRLESKSSAVAVELHVRKEVTILKEKGKIRVQISYMPNSEKTNQLINSRANKLKELASEFSLSDLRNAKSQVFASALQLNKKK